MHGQEGDFGFYIKTCVHDFHLAKALIASIREHAPGADITLIPDDGHDEPTLWGEKAMVSDDPFLLSLTGYYKKLWIFFGPYERFIYVDADILALRSLAALVERVGNAREPFFIVGEQTKFRAWMKEGDEQRIDEIYTTHLGDLSLMREFDEDYVWKNRYPFNSGFLATHRGVFPKEWVIERMNAAQEFHRQRGIPPLGFGRQGLFMGDQGFINYAAARLDLDLDLLPDVHWWGGRPMPDDADAQAAEDPLRFLFIHWAGCPRPSFVCRNVPAGDLWIRSYRRFYEAYGHRLTWAREVAKQIRVHVVTGAKKAAKAALSRGRTE